MRPQILATRKRPSEAKAVASLSLQEELVAAIHGAFEVAVDIAVREVSKLVGQATGDICEEMRRENESLKQRLQRAEAMLLTGGSSPPSTQHLPPDATRNPDPPPHHKHSHTNPNVGDVHGCPGVRGDSPPAGLSRAEQHPDPQQDHVGKHEEQRPGDDVSDAAAESGGAVARDVFTKEGREEMSPVRGVSINQTGRDPAAQDHNSPPQVTQATVKQETPKEERDCSACCLDSVKVEDFRLECMSAVQSKMLEEWKPEVLDIQSQDSNTEPDPAHAPNLTTNLPSPSDLPSLSSEFPNIFQLAEPAPIPEAAPQVCGVHVRTSRNLGHTFTNLYVCKFCGQTFHLPSLLRRHTGQCQQRLQQCCQQPVAGSNRTRLQLYPPGCSPFRCTECNREFNRMENLKTHLRIHTGERPYTCSVCSKCFRHSGALTRHFRIHTGEKPYICGQCGKSFRNCGGLKFHQRSHSKQLQ